MKLPFAIERLIYNYQKRRGEVKEIHDTIWFDEVESVLRRGNRSITIETESLEYYVCKLAFKLPDEYHNDIAIFYAYDTSKETDRGVYQAVRRLNEKSIKILKIEDGLFKRKKESTSINPTYRKDIKV